MAMDTIISKFKSFNKFLRTVSLIGFIIVLLVILSVFKGFRGPDKKTEDTPAAVVTESTTESSYEDTAPETEAVTETTTEATTVTTTEVTTEKKTERTGIDPDFKAFWDEYEAYMDKYIKFMKNPDPSSLEYLSIIAEYADWLEKSDAYEENKGGLTNEEIAYMTAVQLRVNAKLATM